MTPTSTPRHRPPDPPNPAEICTPTKPSRWAVGGALAVLWITTGANFLGFRIAVESWPPFLMVGARLLLAGLLMLPIAWICNQWAWPSRRQMKATLRSALLLLVLGQGALVWAVQTLPAGTTAMLSAAVPLWIAILGLFLFGERVGSRAKVGLALGFTGLALLALSAGGGDERFDFVAAGVMVAGTMAWALGALLDGRSEGDGIPVLGVALQMLIAGLVLSATAFVAGEFSAFSIGTMSARAWFAFSYLVVIGSVVGFGSFIWVNRNTSATVSSSFNYVSPVVALALSAWLLDEAITLVKVAAGITSLVGVALMISGRAERRREST